MIGYDYNSEQVDEDEEEDEEEEDSLAMLDNDDWVLPHQR